MADTQIDYGVAHIYGLKGTIAYLTCQSDSVTNSLALDVEVSDETGRVITDRLDDKRIETTFDGVLKTSTDFTAIIGAHLTYGDVQYIIKSIDDKGTNKDFRKVSIKGIKYQEIA
jgi:hypothetical protein